MKKSEKSKSNGSSFANGGSGSFGCKGTIGPNLMAPTNSQAMLIDDKNVNVVPFANLHQQLNTNAVNKIVLPKGIIRFNNSSANRGVSNGSKSAEKTTRKGG